MTQSYGVLLFGTPCTYKLIRRIILNLNQLHLYDCFRWNQLNQLPVWWTTKCELCTWGYSICHMYRYKHKHYFKHRYSVYMIIILDRLTIDWRTKVDHHYTKEYNNDKLIQNVILLDAKRRGQAHKKDHKRLRICKIWELFVLIFPFIVLNSTRSCPILAILNK